MITQTTEKERQELGWDKNYTDGFDDGRQYERDNPAYSHRNGETDDPEIDGWYFVDWLGEWSMQLNPCQPYENIFFDKSCLAKFYGPIPMPKDFRGK